MSSTPENNLSKIAKDFEDDVSANLSSYVYSYRERFAKRIDTDNARELCPAYAESHENRARLAPLIHEPASQIVKAVWRGLLDESFGEPGLVIFLAGGPGSGKSTVANYEKFQNRFQEAIVVYDTTFSNPSSAGSKIQDALNARKDIDIWYVHRSAKDAAYSVVERAVRTGRTVPIQEVANIHWGAQETIFMLCDQYRYSESVTIHLFNNGGSPESFDWFHDEGDLQGIRYASMMEVEKLVNSGASAAYARIREDNGSFPRAIALGIFGREHPFD
jgi:predicted kinase